MFVLLLSLKLLRLFPIFEDRLEDKVSRLCHPPLDWTGKTHVEVVDEPDVGEIRMLLVCRDMELRRLAGKPQFKRSSNEIGGIREILLHRLDNNLLEQSVLLLVESLYEEFS
jgi:hypothetical protein